MKDTRGVNHLEINCASADGKPDITYYVADDTSGEYCLSTYTSKAISNDPVKLVLRLNTGQIHMFYSKHN